MKVLFLIGRILVGGYFLMNGVGHLTNHAAMAPLVAAKGIPLPDLAVIGSGLLIVLGGASIVLGTWPRVGTWLIIIFLLVVSPLMHNYWADTDPNQRGADTVNFTKNMALLGAVLMTLIIPQPWPYSSVIAEKLKSRRLRPD